MLDEDEITDEMKTVDTVSMICVIIFCIAAIVLVVRGG